MPSLTAACVLALAMNQGPADRVLPIYRNLLDGGDAVSRMRTAHDAACGANNGPFTLLSAETRPDVAAGLAKRIDAAGVPALIDRALARSRAALAGPAVTICVFAGENTGGLPYLGGVGGLSVGGGRIKLFLHPDPGGLARVGYTVAHEYHHEVDRVQGPQPRFGPLNTVIREGKADTFAMSLYPDFRPGHTLPLSDVELRETWRQLMAYEEDPSGFGAAFMIGRFPNGTRWPGYRLGYEMVDAYVRATGLSPAQWTRTPAADIAAHFRTTPRFTALR